MKITVIGAGYVGLANALALSKKYNVVIADIDKSKVKKINSNQSPINDKSIEDSIGNCSNIFATCNIKNACKAATYIFVCVPTNMDCNGNGLDVSIVEDTINKVLDVEPDATIIIKSTLPIGFTKRLKQKKDIAKLIFAPEFLREGYSLYDTLEPNRIIIGVEKNKKEELKLAENYIQLWENIVNIKSKRHIVIVDYSEAEAIKLFSNSYLAIRIAFFNELDCFAMENGLSTKNIIEGVCLDDRIGMFYNNPSFGYGGSCLPKDIKQLSIQHSMGRNSLINIAIESNMRRKQYIAKKVIDKINQEDGTKTVGFFGLASKLNSGNARFSAVIDIINLIKKAGIYCIIYEPLLDENSVFKSFLVNNLVQFKNQSQIIIANRFSPELSDVNYKVFSRDIFLRD